jgi:hypothetical protein
MNCSAKRESTCAARGVGGNPDVNPGFAELLAPAGRPLSESMELATPAAAPPPTLGRYELLSVLGRGGMANVYLGRHAGASGFQRLFAIKVLHPHLAEEEAFVEMLLDEAHIAARLHHPNVVPIVDLGTQDGIHYVVMEYVEGCTLSALLKKNRDLRPPRLIIPIILDAESDFAVLRLGSSRRRWEPSLSRASTT